MLVKLDTKCKKASEDEIEDETEEYEYLKNVAIIPPAGINYVIDGLCATIVLSNQNGTSAEDSENLETYWR